MSINFPSNPALDDLFTDSSNVEWKCIDATVGDVQWARTGKIANVDIAPIGSILAWASSSIPAGWLECNGQSTSPFPDLAAVVGANVPDLRGEFIRGFDNGAGNDPEAGRVLGSLQGEGFKLHTHSVTDPQHLHGGVVRQAAVNTTVFADQSTSATSDRRGTGNNASADTNLSSTGVSVNETGGTETRPRNIALIYIIKAYNAVTTTQGILFPNKNYIINPTIGLINQRGFDGTSTLSEYSFDRWRKSNPTVPLPDADGFINLGNNGLGDFQQRVEIGAVPFGEVLTVSWEGTAVGTEYNSEGQVFQNPRTSPYTFTATAGFADTLAIISFNNGSLKNVKLELGSVATPFEYPDVGSELLKCQRYYQVHNWDFMAHTTVGWALIAPVPMSTSMRIAPNVTELETTSTNLQAITWNGRGVHDVGASLTPTATGSTRWIGLVYMDAEL